MPVTLSKAGPGVAKNAEHKKTPARGLCRRWVNRFNLSLVERSQKTVYVTITKDGVQFLLWRRR